ncbi:MAG TPA: pyridoxal-dependent decarboxylase [Chthonomonadaceae bacterium]|nr:pyridoxal-dependent decarboxylase [Chthonomonadaceae bacterium]
MHRFHGELGALAGALETLAAAFADLPPFASAEPDLTAILQEAAARLRDNYPYFHPLYAGQMLKPPHTAARLAYALAMTINPNNHALDGGRASSEMEKEAVAQIAAMFGWTTCLGHLCGGGTMANLEALWIARELDAESARSVGLAPSGVAAHSDSASRSAPAAPPSTAADAALAAYAVASAGGGSSAPGPRAIAASTQAHYTHSRLSGVLGVPFEAIPSDRRGRMDVGALESRLKAGGIGTVVATMGTTATGAVDPLPELLDLRDRYGFRLHADAAYGGYFTLAGNLAADARAAFDRIGEADSIVVDPHKHGLQPYGCGCILFRDPSVGSFYKHDSPYTYFSSGALHLGEISLECSRPGAAAVALWTTLRLLPLERGGDFATGLERGRTAALRLHERLRADRRFLAAFPPELDIVAWLPRAASLSEASRRTQQIFDVAAGLGLHLALAELPAAFFDLEGVAVDRETALCLRSVLMKPEHLEWLDEIWRLLDVAADSPRISGACSRK